MQFVIPIIVGLLGIGFGLWLSRKRFTPHFPVGRDLDTLTELPTRHHLLDQLPSLLAHAKDTGKLGALVVADIDQFKLVNDMFGHRHGDLLLMLVAKRLSGVVRKQDLIYRSDGDEFSIALTGLTSHRQAHELAIAIQQCMTRKITVGSTPAVLSVSMGVTTFPDQAETEEQILSNAGLSVRSCKESGCNDIVFFHQYMNDAISKRLQILTDLRVALKSQQFEVYYQPILDLKTGRTHKAEALLRWNHPEKGVISPVEFIPVAEETGQITQIGDWVFKEAAAQTAAWRREISPELEVSVNASPIQFNDKHMIQKDWILHLLKLNLPGTAVVVEITEGLLMNGSETVSNNLFALRNIDIQVSLDDFGTGYSSLAYLKDFYIDYLKIDKAFVVNLKPGSEDLALCTAIVSMAHTLGIKVVAEGIETPEQRDLLASIGCDYGQGFFISPPVPARQFEERLLMECGDDDLQ